MRYEKGIHIKSNRLKITPASKSILPDSSFEDDSAIATFLSLFGLVDRLDDSRFFFGLTDLFDDSRSLSFFFDDLFVSPSFDFFLLAEMISMRSFYFSEMPPISTHHSPHDDPLLFLHHS